MSGLRKLMIRGSKSIRWSCILTGHWDVVAWLELIDPTRSLGVLCSYGAGTTVRVFMVFTVFTVVSI